MRIGIDNISPGEATGMNGPGGMRLYLRSLLDQFGILAPQHQFLLFTATWADRLLNKDFPNVEVVNMPGVPRNRFLRVLYQQTKFAQAIRSNRLDLFFATATVAPLLLRVPVVLSVQFLQFYDFPHAYGPFQRYYLRMMLPLSVKKAARVIIFTKSSKEDLKRRTGVPADKIEVVPHGISESFLGIEKERARMGGSLTGGKPYILYVSATYGYKNHIRLIQAFGILKKRIQTPHILLLIGSEVKISFNTLRAAAQEAGVSEEVVIAGRLEQKKVIDAYLGADCAVIPTLYETFGFPVLEAMASECPVITSNYGSMAELSGGAAVLVDPYSADSIADGMERVLVDPNVRRNLIDRGRERARAYTWERSAVETLRVLEESARR